MATLPGATAPPAPLTTRDGERLAVVHVTAEY